MAASKEARVPFVNKDLISYMYRLNPILKINQDESKIPLRQLLKNLNLHGPLNRKKIGFSATINTHKQDRKKEYDHFQQIVLESLDIDNDY